MSNKSKSSGCPPPPDIKDQAQNINKMLDSIGASQKCKSAFNHEIDSSLAKGDAAIGFIGPEGFGGGTASFTNSRNKTKESLDKEGCSDVYANINQQLNATQSILCEVSNNKSTTSLSGSANASIKIIQPEPTPQILKLRSEALKLISKPVPPLQPGIAGGRVTQQDIDLYKVASANYNQALNIEKEQINSIMGNVTIENSNFKNKANVDMQVVGNMSTVDTTAIAEQFKQTAQNSALNELKNKAGIGATSDSVKSLVSTRINNKNQSITNSIKNNLQNITLSSQSDASVLIKAYGAITIDGVTFDQYAQGRLITQNIMTSASNLGKSIALDMLSDAHTSTKSDKESTGEDKVLKQLLDGQVALSKANSEGAANMLKGLTGFLGGFALIPIIAGIAVLLFFPQIANVIAPGPLKYVLIAVLMYFLIAWFIGFWPFSKSEKSIFPYDGLAYVMTEHRGDPEGRGPYNWHVDHRWKMQ